MRANTGVYGNTSVSLLDRAFEAEINHYDIGSDIYYKGSERSLAPFHKANKGNIWVASKGGISSVRIKPAGSSPGVHAGLSSI